MWVNVLRKLGNDLLLGVGVVNDLLPELGNDLVPVDPEVGEQLVLGEGGKGSGVSSGHLHGRMSVCGMGKIEFPNIWEQSK